ncbi:AP-1 complex subunit mu-1 [Amphibalanus amphitrite]|uniref:AP-1 complex subunit mu-1 n=1 Tax=Amphibalanus amphitrite TaxID=1232801 RepID=A0A6A4WP88_AMPAM|nr:AP-1 complex subunit mu-1 [Amphibalanus amphitrite]
MTSDDQFLMFQIPAVFKLSAKMSVSSIYLLDSKGKVLISRNYRGDIEPSVIDKFMPLLMDREEEGNMSPIIQTSGCTFMYIKHSNVYVVSTTRKNANVSLVFVFLHRLVQVFEHYFKELEEESLRDNFVIVYELLDELNDFGFPQTT